MPPPTPSRWARNGVGYGASAQITAPPLGPGGAAARGAAPEETEDELVPEGQIPDGPVVSVAKPAAGPAPVERALTAAPNPFNPETVLSFPLPEAGVVRLAVYNLAVQPVRVLAAGEPWPAGVHTVTWDGRDTSGRPVASGLYLVRLEAGGSVRVGKIALLR